MKKINPLPHLRSFFSGIRFRLTLWFVLILALVLGAFIGSVYSLQGRDLRRQTLSRLEYNINRLQAVYQINLGSIILTAPNPDLSLVLQPDDVLYVHSLKGETLTNYGPLTQMDMENLVQVTTSQDLTGKAFQISLSANPKRTSGSEYIFVSTTLLISRSQAVYLLLGSPLDPGNQLRRLLTTLILAGVGLLALAMFGGYWLADRAMRPVKSITQTARQISESDLTRRINLKANDELGQLAATFDEMLGRLQAAFERQRQFTADASHELRTPLTIISLEAGYALAGERPVQEYQRTLGVILNENEYMVHLVNDLLILSRMDAGQTSLKHEPCDLSDLTVDVAERLTALARRRGVTIEFTDLPETPLQGDRQLLTQMISNLLENAIKYSPEGSGRVELATGMDGETVWFRVADHGPGIPMEHQAHIFERFFRVDTARNHNEGGETPTGSGLGLAIVKWIVEAHRGEIQLTSAEGQGSVFEVRLPAHISTN
jgi:two-component system OmpR family sensor kinase